MKKHQAKTAKIAVLGYSAAMALAGSVVSTEVSAAVNCTAGTATTPVGCAMTSGADDPWGQNWNLSGSNNLNAVGDDDATGFGFCTWHLDSKNSYGVTSEGGVMTVRTASGGTANRNSGCA